MQYPSVLSVLELRQHFEEMRRSAGHHPVWPLLTPLHPACQPHPHTPTPTAPSLWPHYPGRLRRRGGGAEAGLGGLLASWAPRESVGLGGRSLEVPDWTPGSASFLLGSAEMGSSGPDSFGWAPSGGELPCTCAGHNSLEPLVRGVGRGGFQACCFTAEPGEGAWLAQVLGAGCRQVQG